MIDGVPGLLASMVVELERTGALRSKEWRAAVLAVPRHVFLTRFYVDEVEPGGVTLFRPVSAQSGEEEWLEMTYADRTWATQLDGSVTPPAFGNLVTGVPTCSSTRPSTVVRRLEDLKASRGARILALGTGTGYSTPLLCERLGSSQVSSVEYDAALSKVAGDRLAGLGYHPRLVVGDGDHGRPNDASYDGGDRSVLAVARVSRLDRAGDRRRGDSRVDRRRLGHLRLHAATEGWAGPRGRSTHRCGRVVHGHPVTRKPPRPDARGGGRTRPRQAHHAGDGRQPSQRP